MPNMQVPNYIVPRAVLCVVCLLFLEVDFFYGVSFALRAGQALVGRLNRL